MSGRIETYNQQKDKTNKWSKNETFEVRKAGVDIGEDFFYAPSRKLTGSYKNSQSYKGGTGVIGIVTD